MKDSLPLRYEEQVRKVGENEYELEQYNVYDKNGNHVIMAMMDAPTLVKACNNYYKLVEALESIGMELDHKMMFCKKNCPACSDFVLCDKLSEAQKFIKSLGDNNCKAVAFDSSCNVECEQYRAGKCNAGDNNEKETCLYCKELKSLHYERNGVIQEIYIELDKTLTVSHPEPEWSVNININYCPMCGAKLVGDNNG